MQGDVNKLFVFKSLLTTPSNALTLHLKQTFPPIIWIFTEGDGIKSRLPFRIFSTLTQMLICSWHNSHICEFYVDNSAVYLKNKTFKIIEHFTRYNHQFLITQPWHGDKFVVNYLARKFNLYVTSKKRNYEFEVLQNVF